MNPLHISDEAKRLQLLQDALKARIEARDVLAMKRGQMCATMIVCGMRFDVTILDNSYYQPTIVKGMDVIHAELMKIMDAHVDNARSAVEGAEWKLRQLVRSGQ